MATPNKRLRLDQGEPHNALPSFSLSVNEEDQSPSPPLVTSPPPQEYSPSPRRSVCPRSRAPSLDGPESYNVYFAHDPTSERDGNLQRKLKASLEDQQPRYHCFTATPNRSIVENIRDGVESSQKVVVLMSEDYLMFDWFEYEKDQVILKSKARGRACVVVVLVPTVGVPCELPCLFKEFQYLKYEDTPTFRNNLLDFLRQDVMPRKLSNLPRDNFGTPNAWTYYYGYLKIILAALPSKIAQLETVSKLSSDNGMIYIPKKLLLIIPQSCHAPPSLTKIDPNIKQVDWITTEVNWSGCVGRIYRNSVYQLADEEKEYSVVAEMPVPLVAMYEVYRGEVAGLTAEELTHAAGQFYFTLKAILQLHQHEDCAKHVCLLFYKDKQEPLQPFRELLLNTIQCEERNELAGLDEVDTAVMDMDRVANIATSATSDTLEKVPSADYRIPKVESRSSLLPRYRMKANPRGWALILCNVTFYGGNLSHRQGGEKDADMLYHLFESLHFKPYIVMNKTAADMLSALKAIRDLDHTNFDAFACCICTHGSKGRVAGIHGESLSIVEDIASLFYVKNCKSLGGKPKMFFIEACQIDKLVEAPNEGCNAARPLSRHHSCNSEPSPDLSPSIESPLTFLPASQTGQGEHSSAPQLNREQSQDLLERFNQLYLGNDNDSPGSRSFEVCPTPEPSGRPRPRFESDDLKSTRPGSTDLVPQEKDFLMSYCALPGSKSYRYPPYGSFYVLALRKCIMRYKLMLDLGKILKHVSHEVKEYIVVMRQYIDEVTRQGRSIMTETIDDDQLPFFIPLTGSKYELYIA